jgi:hypothetical protein
VDLEISDINDPYHSTIGYNGYMINRWQSAISLMNKSGRVYDRVILLRPDIVLDYYEDFFKYFMHSTSNDDNDIYAICGGSLGDPFPLNTIRKVSDLLFIGTQNSILKLLNLPLEGFLKTKDREKLSNSNLLDVGPVVDVHTFLVDHFLSMYSRYMNIPVRWCIARSNSRGLGKISFTEVKENTKKWYEMRYRKFFDNIDNMWGNLPSPDPIIRPTEDRTSYNLWNKYDFSRKHWYDNVTAFWNSPDDEYTYEQTKVSRQNQEHITYKDHDFAYRYNSFGFRKAHGGPLEFDEDHSYFTFLVAGCSITEGIGLPEEHLWNSFLL